jgi:hypothetical protein
MSPAHLVQLFLPVGHGGDATATVDALSAVRGELVEKFGGVTAHLRAPADGLWLDDGSIERDDVVIVELVVVTFDRAWWTSYKTTLEARFCQKSIHVRVMSLSVL